MNGENTYGLVAEFQTPEQLVRSAEQAHAHGYRRMDAFTPFPIEGLPKALGKRTRLPLLVLIGGIVGGTGAYFMQWYANAVSYPLNVGGRPIHSWPAFIPITFELTVLAAALTAFLAVFVLSGLPRLHHPLFTLPQFERASEDRFFLCIESRDPEFELEKTRKFLVGLNPVSLTEARR
jgi:ActD protein